MFETMKRLTNHCSETLKKGIAFSQSLGISKKYSKQPGTINRLQHIHKRNITHRVAFSKCKKTRLMTFPFVSFEQKTQLEV